MRERVRVYAERYFLDEHEDDKKGRSFVEILMIALKSLANGNLGPPPPWVSTNFPYWSIIMVI